MEEEKCI